MITDLMENERLDDLQRNGLKIIQKTDGFCFGMDAVLLSGFASVKPGRWIWVPGPGSSPFSFRQKQKETISLGWRSRQRS